MNNTLLDDYYYEVSKGSIINYIYVEVATKEDVIKKVDDIKAEVQIKKMFFAGLYLDNEGVNPSSNVYVVGTPNFKDIYLCNLGTHNVLNVTYRCNGFVYSVYFKNDSIEQKEAGVLLFKLLEHLQVNESEKVCTDRELIDTTKYSEYDLTDPLLLGTKFTEKPRLCGPPTSNTVPIIKKQPGFVDNNRAPWKVKPITNKTEYGDHYGNYREPYTYSTIKEPKVFKRTSKKPGKKKLDKMKMMVILLREGKYTPETVSECEADTQQQMDHLLEGMGYDSTKYPLN